MNMNQEFINFVNALIAAAPDVAEKLMNENIKRYMEILVTNTKEKPEMTDNGKLILDYLQKDTSRDSWKSRDIGEGLGISSRTISGSIRKLVTDGFVDKIGENPVIYILTEKGKNYQLY